MQQKRAALEKEILTVKHNGTEKRHKAALEAVRRGIESQEEVAELKTRLQEFSVELKLIELRKEVAIQEATAPLSLELNNLAREEVALAVKREVASKQLEKLSRTMEVADRAAMLEAEIDNLRKAIWMLKHQQAGLHLESRSNQPE